MKVETIKTTFAKKPKQDDNAILLLLPGNFRDKMNDVKRIKTEKLIIRQLIEVYCRGVHHSPSGLCDECQDLYRYTLERIDKCFFGIDKPTCQNCPVHCYGKERKQQVIKVMRYAGPKMPYKHPLSAIIHVRNKIIDRKKIPGLLVMLKQRNK